MLQVQIEELQTTNQLITFPRRRTLHDTLCEVTNISNTHLLGRRSGSSSPISNVILRNICERKNIPQPEWCTAMKPLRLLCQLDTCQSTHTCSHVHTCWYSSTEASPSRFKTVHEEEEERERESVLLNRKKRLRWGGRRGEGVLLAHFRSGSCRPLQENSTSRPIPLSQSPWLS